VGGADKLLHRYAPKFIGQAIDAMKGNFTMSEIVREVGLAVLFSALGGFCLFCVRQTIVVVSRKIEYDLKKRFLRALANALAELF
jgi:ATP-binding cassette subfamily B multidrug efflux pump